MVIKFENVFLVVLIDEVIGWGIGNVVKLCEMVRGILLVYFGFWVLGRVGLVVIMVKDCIC